MWDRFTRWCARKHLMRIHLHLINEAMDRTRRIGDKTTVLEDHELVGESRGFRLSAGWITRYRRGQCE
jgi:hypothetical protein